MDYYGLWEVTPQLRKFLKQSNRRKQIHHKKSTRKLSGAFYFILLGDVKIGKDTGIL